MRRFLRSQKGRFSLRQSKSGTRSASKDFASSGKGLRTASVRESRSALAPLASEQPPGSTTLRGYRPGNGLEEDCSTRIRPAALRRHGGTPQEPENQGSAGSNATALPS
ncbi:hypothetical protein AAFF_G00160610 [Aldrovandia affinis]|uniref:Uncharacterized protein n=1 Tax=Aldrovandia affinis TaxID=143900 RepID=A0AAD7RMQ1_9TELE|nr:hypothetical protein AAFF_G00160610 [Aldrovandia affinis]